MSMISRKDREAFEAGKGEQHLELEVLGGASEPATEIATATSKAAATAIEIKTATQL